MSEYLTLTARLKNWGRLYIENNEPHGQSNIYSIMRKMGYLPEYSDKKATPGIDYRDALIVDKAYHSLEVGSLPRNYIGVFYCTRCNHPNSVCRKLGIPTFLYDDLEKKSLRLIQKAIYKVEEMEAKNNI